MPCNGSNVVTDTSGDVFTFSFIFFFLFILPVPKAVMQVSAALNLRGPGYISQFFVFSILGSSELACEPGLIRFMMGFPCLSTSDTCQY